MTCGNEHKGYSGQDLETVTRAYQSLPDEEPPALLDQAILNAARRAAGDKTVRPWNFGWIHALSTAAVLVLGLALLLQQTDPPAGEPLRVNKPPNSKLEKPVRHAPDLQVLKPAETDTDARPGVIRELRVAPQTQEPGTMDPDRQAASGVSKAAPAEDGRRERSGFMASDTLVPEAETSEALDLEAVAASAELREQTAEETPRSPEAWLSAILELRKRGDMAAFEAELEAFQAAWPDFPLPPELTE